MVSGVFSQAFFYLFKSFIFTALLCEAEKLYYSCFMKWETEASLLKTPSRGLVHEARNRIWKLLSFRMPLKLFFFSVCVENSYFDHWQHRQYRAKHLVLLEHRFSGSESTIVWVLCILHIFFHTSDVHKKLPEEPFIPAQATTVWIATAWSASVPNCNEVPLQQQKGASCEFPMWKGKAALSGLNKWEGTDCRAHSAGPAVTYLAWSGFQDFLSS